jgi:murein DD-endopeptidase MepM/ murein hydrolase activator NlpD
MSRNQRRPSRRGWTILILPDQGEPRPFRLAWGIIAVAALLGISLGIGAIGAPMLLAGSVTLNATLGAKTAQLEAQRQILEHDLAAQKKDYEAKLNKQQRNYEAKLNIEVGKVAGLTRQARSVTAKLSDLQNRLTYIQNRAGITVPQRASSGRPRGGATLANLEVTDPAQMFSALDGFLDQTEGSLQQALGPLEGRLRREAAIPAGWPSVGPITSGFGVRIGPRSRRIERHTGWDIAAGYGARVAATAPGTVVEAGWSNVGYGMHIVIDHGYGYRTLFGHLSRMYVSVGESIGIGTPLGAVGSTGNSTGPHLHYEVRIGGQPVNPGPYLNRSRVRAVDFDAAKR